MGEAVVSLESQRSVLVMSGIPCCLKCEALAATASCPGATLSLFSSEGLQAAAKRWASMIELGFPIEYECKLVANKMSRTALIVMRQAILF